MLGRILKTALKAIWEIFRILPLIWAWTVMLCLVFDWVSGNNDLSLSPRSTSLLYIIVGMSIGAIIGISLRYAAKEAEVHDEERQKRGDVGEK